MSSKNKFELIIDNNWENVKAEMRHAWRKLTEEDVDAIQNYQDLVKKLQEIYEITEEQVNDKISSFIEKLNLEPNLTKLQELKEALYENTMHIKDKISEKINKEALQKNAKEVQHAVTEYVKENPLKALGLGVLASWAIVKMLRPK
ncbi:MAG: hypothetical protein K0S27_1027 [Gammaproteobacteria bacterium]|jgi:ElaB/YqjD/DUF883 family membrane-anchored ribosome-binding protein|nr:hypothetical protein [Gammaproteobacteria bacterium]